MNRTELTRAAERIALSDAAKERIMARSLLCAERKETPPMSGKKIRRTVVLIAAVMMLLTVSAYGLNGTVASWGTARSSYYYSFDSLPSPEKLEKELGYLPAITAAFENGYTLRNGSISYGAFFDEDYNELERYKEMSVTYEKDGDKLIYGVKKFNTPMDATGGDVIAVVDGVPVKYSAYTNKLVPEDYRMTDEDKAAQESGALIFSWGSDSVEIVRVQGVNWEQDGVFCGFTQIDGRLAPEELAAMAAELITRR